MLYKCPLMSVFNRKWCYTMEAIIPKAIGCWAQRGIEIDILSGPRFNHNTKKWSLDLSKYKKKIFQLILLKIKLGRHLLGFINQMRSHGSKFTEIVKLNLIQNNQELFI